jgi:outer membrane protein TolC
VSKSQSIFGVVLLLSASRVAICTDEASAWHLSDVIERASSHVTDKDTSVQTARLELEMLEAQNKTHVDFRPQLSILSFSNPLFLAASLGGSISISRRNAPSPLNMELARFAVVEAEVNRAQARITSRIETTRQFFVLAESQDLAERACRSWDMRKHDRDKLQSLVSLNRITKLDVIRFEQDVTSLESECVEAKAQRQLAAIALVRLVGLEATPEQLQVSTDDLSEVSAVDLPTSTDLVNAAVESQSEFNAISLQMSNLATAGTKRKIHFDTFSTGYSYLKNAEKSSPDLGKQYLLGGNVGHIDAGFYVPLRNTGDEKATYNFLQARFDRLQGELKDLKLSVRFEIEDNVQRATLAAARLRLSQKKQQLAEELHALTMQRRDAGLQPSTDELWAQRDADRAETDTARSELEWKRTAFTALSLSNPDKFTSLAAAAHTKKPPVTNTAKLEPAVVNASLTVPPVRTEFKTFRLDLVQDNHITQEHLVHAIAPPVITPAATVPAAPHLVPVVAHRELPPPSLGVYSPARPLNRVLPDPKFAIGAIIYTTTQVDIDVSIDDQGTVLDARIASAPAGMSRALLGQAVAAAKMWKFEPAKLHGKNIASSHTITFLFHPNS